jgi:hypothetical protein
VAFALIATAITIGGGTIIVILRLTVWPKIRGAFEEDESTNPERLFERLRDKLLDEDLSDASSICKAIIKIGDAGWSYQALDLIEDTYKLPELADQIRRETGSQPRAGLA